jgi:hypothetical protein
LEPAAELKSIELSLVENKAQHLFTNHFTNPSGKNANQGLISARGTAQSWVRKAHHFGAPSVMG